MLRRIYLPGHATQVCCLTRSSTLAGILATLAGCVASPPSPARPSVARTPAPQAAVGDSVEPPFSPQFIYQPGQLRYRLQISSSVQLTGGDSVHRTDSTRVTGNLNVRLLSLPGRDQVAAQVQPDSILVAAGGGTSEPIASASLLSFQIDHSTGRVKAAETIPNSRCDLDSGQHPPFSGTEVLPSMQPRFTATWVDTSTTTMCRAGVLLALTRTATYVRLNPLDTTYQFLRSTRLTLTGTGHQWNQQVDVSGEGTGTDTLYLSGSPLRLQEISGNSHLRLQFRAPLKTQEFTQTTVTRIVLQR